MIPKLYELDIINARILEAQRNAMRAEQARMAAKKPADPLPYPIRTSPLEPIAAFFARIRHMRLLHPRHAT